MTKEGRRYRWSEEEISYLRDNYGKVAMEDIGRRLGISHTTVRLKALELGLATAHVRNRCEWTKEKVDYLRRNYHKEADVDLAMHIGFSPGTIYRMANRLGLKKSDKFDKRGFQRRYVKEYRN